MQHLKRKKDGSVDRTKALEKSFKDFKRNEGGPVTFHFTKKIAGKGTIVTHTRTIQMDGSVVNNRNVGQLMFVLQSVQHDLGADYFTF